MKKVAFLLVSILLISFCTVNAQDVLKFKSFDFHKGVVSFDRSGYDSFTFMIKHKKKSSGIVSSVSVEGLNARFTIEIDGAYSIYTVSIPKSKLIKVGDEFEVTISFVPMGIRQMFSSKTPKVAKSSLEGFLSPYTLSPLFPSPEDGGPGGPGSGGDPTVIIVKYP